MVAAPLRFGVCLWCLDAWPGGYFELANVFFFEPCDDFVAGLVDRLDLVVPGFLVADFFGVGFFTTEFFALLFFGEDEGATLAAAVGLITATVMSAGLEVSCFDGDLAAICGGAAFGPLPRMTSD